MQVATPRPDRDVIGRRRRDRRSPEGKVKKSTERSLIWFEKLHRHGPLPSTFLHAYTEHLCRNAAWARRELADLFHEDSVHGGPYLDRPWQQFDTMDARHHDLVYDLTEAAEDALAETGRFRANTQAPGGPWVHRHMVACITASIELAALARDDIRFIFQDEIVKGPLRTPVPYTHNGRTETRDLVPDAVFALAYRTPAGERYRHFALEADRGTEPGRSNSFDRKSQLRTVLQYRTYVGEGQYKTHLGVSAPMLVLTVTASSGRLGNLIELVAKTSETGRNSFMLFQHLPQFGRYFTPPKPVPSLLSSAWRRAGHTGLRIDYVS
ncbi:replication-relaxation family protein [Thalassobaculum salexigens]|uniref:replication-relaxation family protein n=1 Tax=Thalassobaculum salexigens TaxID=455360 RepID=UPI00048F3F56|nr:replication-relaxation family protein [Thalassobaculum salexigens]